eukprot:PRCOL_00006877-RA
MGEKDLDYLKALMSIQAGGPRTVGFFGTRNMGYHQQQLIEILSYALILTGNHIFTSGATGTDAAVIRGALRADAPELLTVVLPQSVSKQPPESQELLKDVQTVISKPENDELALGDASRICNADIITRVEQVICFAFHDSKLLMETCEKAREENKIVTLFFLD